MKTLEELERLGKALERSPLPRAREEWIGADVAITSEAPPEPSKESFYPEPRFVVTSYSLELSWLFEGVAQAFWAEERLDGCNKIEFFGRLANAADHYLRLPSAPTGHLLCATVLREAFAIYDEMERGAFECLLVAMGNEIADDHADETARASRLDRDAVLAFFRDRGLRVKVD